MIFTSTSVRIDFSEILPVRWVVQLFHLPFVLGQRWLAAFQVPADRETLPTRDMILRFQQGQPGAFEMLYEHFKNYVYRIALFLMRDGTEAEDAVQEAFMDVLRALPRFAVDGPASFETWLYRVTVNRCRSRLRRKVLPSSEWEEVSEQLERIPTPELDGDPEGACLERERSLELWRAIDQLPQEHRSVLLLRYGQELSYEEIAEVLNINLGTVKSRLFNAHRKLRQELNAELVGGMEVKGDGL